MRGLTGPAQFLSPSVAGFLLQKELDYLDGAVSDPKAPFCAIVGGSKVSSKIGVIESLMAKCDKIIIGRCSGAGGRTGRRASLPPAAGRAADAGGTPSARSARASQGGA